MATHNLQERFPDFQPITSMPWLTRINGCGFALHGRRDYDEETTTYLKTWCFTLLFVPLLGLRAYRVADADVGWYILGREPLSATVKAWNFLVLIALVGGLGFGAWTNHTKSPGYIAGQRMAQAQSASDAGQLADAARAYADVASGLTKHAGEARDRLQQVVDTGIDSVPADEAAGVVGVLMQEHGPEAIDQAYPDLRSHVLRLARKHSQGDPRGALSLIDSLRGAHEPTEAETALRESLLVGIVASDPDDLETRSELAMIHEARGDEQKCIDLLEPYADRLGDSQGARVLGQLYAARGEIEPAYKLLKPYTAVRLERLREAEEAYATALQAAWDRQIELLNQGAAPDSFYSRYENADEASQPAIVDAYVQEKIKDDRGIGAAVDKMMRESAVVPVALDLGMVMLGRASTISDPDAKRAELESAEQTFLAIRGLAGETDEYRIYLGQVYYWLGKSEQGRELFDQLLATHERSFEVLCAVANSLREVGEVSDARAMIEEAYNTTQDQAQKYTAATIRSLMQRDLDDEIEWLGRANPDESHTQAALNAALGSRAANQGKTEEAKDYFRKAIQGYESQAESTSSLNNAALAYLSLFRVDSDPQTLNHAVTLMDKAVTLMPSDSILMHNTASVHLRTAVFDVVKDRIDLVALGEMPDTEMLAYLYDDAEQRDLVRGRVVSHPSTAKALGYADRMMLVAPKRPDSYEITLRVGYFARDTDRLNALLRRVNDAGIDMADTRVERLAYYAGERDEKYLRVFSERVDKWRAAVDRLRGSDDSTTRAYAMCALVDTSLAKAYIGPPEDSDALVAMAQEALDLSPSSGTRGSLMSALCYRALRQVGASDSNLSAFVDSSRRSLNPRQVAALALGTREPFAATLARHPDIQRVIEMTRDSGERYNDAWDPMDWVMLDTAGSDLVDEVASAVKSNELDRVSRLIARSLYGDNADFAINAFWEARISGNDTEAKAIMNKAIQAGIPLPPVTN
ncbi:MAG: hypothetical protein R3C45_05430 [Phycisphaerales bacterium]